MLSYMSLHMMDEKVKHSKENIKRVYVKRLKFEIHGIGFRVRHITRSNSIKQDQKGSNGTKYYQFYLFIFPYPMYIRPLPISFILYPLSLIPDLLSFIFYPLSLISWSHIQFPMFHVPCQMSHIHYLLSSIPYPFFLFLCPSSLKPYPLTSNWRVKEKVSYKKLLVHKN